METNTVNETETLFCLNCETEQTRGPNSAGQWCQNCEHVWLPAPLPQNFIVFSVFRPNETNNLARHWEVFHQFRERLGLVTVEGVYKNEHELSFIVPLTGDSFEDTLTETIVRGLTRKFKQECFLLVENRKGFLVKPFTLTEETSEIALGTLCLTDEEPLQAEGYTRWGFNKWFYFIQ